AGAGRNVASVVAPVCSPVPRSAAGRVTERLALGDGRRRLGFGWYEPLEVIHDLGEPVERELRAQKLAVRAGQRAEVRRLGGNVGDGPRLDEQSRAAPDREIDRKSTRLNSSHDQISYAVFCLKKKNID